MTNYRPSRPAAIVGAVVGAAVLVFGLVRMLDGGAARDGGGLAFLVLWCVLGVVVVGANLWAAFSAKRLPGTVPPALDDGPPAR